MIRVFIAAVAAGLALFVWGFLSWVVLPWHNMTFRELPNEEQVATALKQSLPESGTYIIPWMVESQIKTADQRAAAMELMTERHRAGPIVKIHYREAGVEPMAPTMFVKGILIDIVAGLAAASLVFLTLPSRPSFGVRVSSVVMAGVMVVTMTQLTDWTFMYHPTDYVVIGTLDLLVGSLIMGIVVAAIVRPPVTQPQD